VRVTDKQTPQVTPTAQRPSYTLLLLLPVLLRKLRGRSHGNAAGDIL